MLRELVYCAVLIAILGALAKAMPPQLRDLWQRFERGLSGLARRKTYELDRTGCVRFGARGRRFFRFGRFQRPPSTMNLVTFSRLTLSRMDVWPTRRIRFGSFLKALTSFSSLPMRPGSRPARHWRWRWTGALRASLVWRLAERGPAGCGPLLGASRVAAAGLGAFRSVHRFGSLSL